MAVVISPDLVISESADGGGGVINANNPIIGYNNLVTASNVSSDTEDTDNPVTNIANNSTNLKWIAAVGSPTMDEYVTLALNTNELVDYVGIAKHNFGTTQATISLEVLEDGSPTTWTELISEFIPANDSPILMRFTPQGITSVRIRIQPGTDEPQMAVVYAGTLLVLQRRIYVGHTPIPYGRSTKIVNGRSENGNFLGRIVLNSFTSTQINMQNITPAFYRTYIDPFIIDSKENPFFFAWRPSTYPTEVGYAWMTNDPQPNNQGPNGNVQISFEMRGVV
jgi:hypothetical protein